MEIPVAGFYIRGIRTTTVQSRCRSQRHAAFIATLAEFGWCHDVLKLGKLDQQYYQSGGADAANAVDGLDGDALAAQLAAKCAVKGIARLKVDRREFDQQAYDLQRHSAVYKQPCYKYRDGLIASWCPKKAVRLFRL